jgi:hypothetical protein
MGLVLVYLLDDGVAVGMDDYVMAIMPRAPK